MNKSTNQGNEYLMIDFRMKLYMVLVGELICYLDEISSRKTNTHRRGQWAPNLL